MAIASSTLLAMTLLSHGLLPLKSAQSEDGIPAFLDAPDEVTVWLEAPNTIAAIKNRIRFFINGESVAVKDVVGREPFKPSVEAGAVTLPGSFQTALGDTAWNPAGKSTEMTEVSAGIYELVINLPAGTHEFKVAKNGSWAENYGAGFTPNGANFRISVPTARAVRFRVDFNIKSVQNSVDHPEVVPVPTTASAPKTVPNNIFQSVKVKLLRPLTVQDVSQDLRVQVDDRTSRRVFARGVLDSEPFTYRGDDLGPTYRRSRTIFRVWSPVSTQVNLVLYEGEFDRVDRVWPMMPVGNGVWMADIPGNQAGRYYQYEFKSYGETRYAADIYGKAASRDSARSVVVSPAATNPAGWVDKKFVPLKRATDAVIYEAHIRDLTINPDSGIPEWFRGRYLGLTEKNSRVPGTKTPTGLEHLKQLGITHLHLLPFQDFNPAHSTAYNWGYETTLFNVPEEQYCQRPWDPADRIVEVKRMVKSLKEEGIGTVMDVVYNHSIPSQGAQSAFWQTVPYYYFRTNDRGDVLNESGVGNALHDERPMVRKFIADSLRYWTREFKIDGFRFDLLGMFTPETVRELAKAIRAENPNALIYGEPWTGGGPLRFAKGAQKGLGVGVFNDHFRGVFRGGLDSNEPGFATGGNPNPDAVIQAITGSTGDFAANPNESINYVSAHDNLTFWDKVAVTEPTLNPDQQRDAVKLAHAAVLLSFGVPFIEGGVEIGRTKGLNGNSYNAGDPANQFNWLRGVQYADVTEFFKKVIALRKAHPQFREDNPAKISAGLKWLKAPSSGSSNSVSYMLSGSASESPVVVILNGSPKPLEVPLPGDVLWTPEIDSNKVLSSGSRSTVKVGTAAPFTATVLVRRK